MFEHVGFLLGLLGRDVQVCVTGERGSESETQLGLALQVLFVYMYGTV